MNDIDKLILLKEEELQKYRLASKDFPMELRRRFSVHYINMLESQLKELQLQKSKESK
jgi:hypothetical protein